MRKLATMQLHFGGSMPGYDEQEADIELWYSGSNHHRPRAQFFLSGVNDAQIDTYRPWNFGSVNKFAPLLLTLLLFLLRFSPRRLPPHPLLLPASFRPYTCENWFPPFLTLCSRLSC